MIVRGLLRPCTIYDYVATSGEDPFIILLQYSDVDLWFGIRPKFGEVHAAIQYADVGLWFGIQPS